MCVDCLYLTYWEKIAHPTVSMKPVYPHLISRCRSSSIREIYHETISTFFSFSHPTYFKYLRNQIWMGSRYLFERAPTANTRKCISNVSKERFKML